MEIYTARHGTGHTDELQAECLKQKHTQSVALNCMPDRSTINGLIDQLFQNSKLFLIFFHAACTCVNIDKGIKFVIRL